MGIYTPNRIVFDNSEYELQKLDNDNTIQNKQKEQIDDYELRYQIEIIDRPENLDDLERQKRNWDAMTIKQKRLSDVQCKAIYGKTNLEMYYKLKTEFEEKNKNLYDDQIEYIPYKESYIEENLIISKTDESIYLDNFISGKSNVLLITGLSGSGKTTLTKKLVNKYNAVHIELDLLDKNLKLSTLTKNDFKDSLKKYPKEKNLIQGDIFIYKYITKVKKELCKMDLFCQPYTIYYEYINDFITWVIDYSKKNNKKIIIEGIHIYSYIPFNFIIENEIPLIIKNTSATKSLLQRWKRQNGGSIKWFKQISNFKNTMNDIRWYSDDFRYIDKFTKEIRDNSNPVSFNIEKINNIKESIEEAKRNNNKLQIASLCMELNSIDTEYVYETMTISNIIDNSIEFMNNNISDIFDCINTLPYFLPEDMENKGIYNHNPINNYYEIRADNLYLDEDKIITTKDWFNNYIAFTNGIFTELNNKYTSLWINKLTNLMIGLNELKRENDINKIKARKQSILELGWNPEIPFTSNIRTKITEANILKLKNKNSNISITDISRYIIKVNDTKILKENINIDNIKPIYIIMKNNDNNIIKDIKEYTNKNNDMFFISLNEDLHSLYNFNKFDNSIRYINIKHLKEESNISVYTSYINNMNYNKLKSMLEKNRIVLDLNKSILLREMSNKLYSNDIIISKFANSILESLIDINSNIYYKVYSGSIKEYNESECIDMINKNNSLIYLKEGYDFLSDKNKIIYENYIKPSFNILNEIKEFPVQFDKEGNLLIKKIKNIDFNSEYSQSHKLLKIYEENNNIEGMKYELSKLWFLTLVIEKKVYNNKNEKDRKIHFNTRARLLNDFNKYLKIVTKEDNTFNFTQYYNNSPFSDATIKINNHTLKYGSNILKNLYKIIKP